MHLQEQVQLAAPSVETIAPELQPGNPIEATPAEIADDKVYSFQHASGETHSGTAEQCPYLETLPKEAARMLLELAAIGSDIIAKNPSLQRPKARQRIERVNEPGKPILTPDILSQPVAPIENVVAGATPLEVKAQLSVGALATDTAAPIPETVRTEPAIAEPTEISPTHEEHTTQSIPAKLEAPVQPHVSEPILPVPDYIPEIRSEPVTYEDPHKSEAALPSEAHVEPIREPETAPFDAASAPIAEETLEHPAPPLLETCAVIVQRAIDTAVPEKSASTDHLPLTDYPTPEITTYSMPVERAALVQVAEALQQTPEASQKDVTSIVVSALEVIREVQALPAETPSGVTEMLTEKIETLCTELLEELGIQPTPELVTALRLLLLKPEIAEMLTQLLPVPPDTAGTHERKHGWMGHRLQAFSRVTAPLHIWMGSSALAAYASAR